MYFGPEEEEAVVKFLTSTDDNERNLIYTNYLKAPIEQMTEAIIRKYKLYRKNETFEDLHGDTISFLMTKVNKFDSTKGTKAYSYFGTICRHYLLGLLQRDTKHLKHVASYDDVYSELEKRDDLKYYINEDKSPMDEFFKKLTVGINKELNDSGLPVKKRLNENERKVGLALVEILTNWETTFDTMSGGSKYNKNSVLETMRNYTNLTTKDIRLAMKRYKDMYALLKEYKLD